MFEQMLEENQSDRSYRAQRRLKRSNVVNASQYEQVELFLSSCARFLRSLC